MKLNAPIIGDCRVVLPTLPEDSVQCVVTSVPYWGLRDYGHPDQMGLEPTPEAYVEAMVAVFREVRRVLRPDGVCWLNIGDSYITNVGQAGRGGPPSASSTLQGNGHRGGGPKLKAMVRASSRGYRGDRLANGRKDQSAVLRRETVGLDFDPKKPGQVRDRERPNRQAAVTGLKHKDMALIPERLSIALQMDGWYHRDKVIWHKPAPMPESVTDRTTRAHEYVLLLSKSAQYFYDAEAIKEQTTGDAHTRGAGVNPKAGGKNESAAAAAAAYMNEANHRRVDGFNERWRVKQNERFSAAVRGLVETRNARSVWTIASTPYAGAHFAVMPPELVAKCVLAGSRIGDVVLDPFFGSGTVGMVAEQLGRKWVGIELNETYAPLIAERTAQRGLFAAEVNHG